MRRSYLLPIVILLIGMLVSARVLAVSITTINGTDTISSSRGVINNNFANLNSGKIESITLTVNGGSALTSSSSFNWVAGSNVTLTPSGTSTITIASTGGGASSTITINGMSSSTFQILGTANQLVVTTSSPTFITLSLPQSIDTSANVQFGSLLVNSSTQATSTVTASFVLGGTAYKSLLGSGLANTTGTLTISGLTTGHFTSANVSQWTNDAGYIANNATGSLGRVALFNSTNTVSSSPNFRFNPDEAYLYTDYLQLFGSTAILLHSNAGTGILLESADGVYQFGSGGGQAGNLDFSNLTSLRAFAFPNKSGTVALTSDLGVTSAASGTGVSVSAPTGPVTFSLNINGGVSQDCGSGNFVRIISPTGTVTCAADQSGGSSTISINGISTSTFQVQASGTDIAVTTSSPSNVRIDFVATVLRTLAGITNSVVNLLGGNGISVSTSSNNITITNTGVTSLATSTPGLAKTNSTGSVTFGLALANNATQDCGAGNLVRMISPTGTVTCAADASGGGGANFATTTVNELLFGLTTNTGTSSRNLTYQTSTDVLYVGGSLGIGTSTPQVPLAIVGPAGTSSAFNVYKSDGTLVSEFRTKGLNAMYMGWHSGVNASSATDNTAFGYAAMEGVTTGFYNDVFGPYALHTLTTGIYNTAVGGGALNQTNGSYNVAVGLGAGDQANGTSSYNTSLGAQAGENLKRGSGNIAIGAFVDFPYTSGTLAVGQLNIGNVLYGTAMKTNIELTGEPVDGGKIGIMTYSPSSTLHVSGTLMVTKSSTFLGDVLDASGNKYSTSTGGGGGGNFATGTAKQIVYFTGTNTGEGTSTLTYATSTGLTVTSRSTTTPAFTLLNPNGSTAFEARTGGGGMFSTFLGYLAGQSKSGSVGTSNTGVGNQALMSLVDGGSNTAVGAGTLASLTGGSRNVAIGANIFANLTNGTDNIAIGDSTGPNLEISGNGNYNLFVGTNSGANLTAGSNNMLFGPYVDAPRATGSRQLNIGNLIYGRNLYNTASNTSTPVATGMVGIGVAIPSTALEVGGVVSSTVFRTPSGTVAILYDAQGNKYSTSTGGGGGGGGLATSSLGQYTPGNLFFAITSSTASADNGVAFNSSTDSLTLLGGVAYVNATGSGNLQTATFKATGNSNVSGTETVTGAVSFQSTLGVSGVTTLLAALNIGGAANFSSTVTLPNVTSSLHLASATGTITAYAGSSCATGSVVASVSATGTVSCVTTSTILTGYSTSTGANPSALIGATPTNGTANTFMRSDGAPAFATSSAWTMSGFWQFLTGGVSTTQMWSASTSLDVANALLMGSSSKKVVAYTGSACGGSDQVTGISATGTVTCSAQGSGGGGGNTSDSSTVPYVPYADASHHFSSTRMYASGTAGVGLDNNVQFLGKTTAGEEFPFFYINDSNDVHFFPDLPSGVGTLNFGFNAAKTLNFGGSCCGGGSPTGMNFQTQGSLVFKPGDGTTVTFAPTENTFLQHTTLAKASSTGFDISGFLRLPSFTGGIATFLSSGVVTSTPTSSITYVKTLNSTTTENGPTSSSTVIIYSVQVPASSLDGGHLEAFLNGRMLNNSGANKTATFSMYISTTTPATSSPATAAGMLQLLSKVSGNIGSNSSMGSWAVLFQLAQASTTNNWVGQFRANYESGAGTTVLVDDTARVNSASFSSTSTLWLSFYGAWSTPSSSLSWKLERATAKQNGATATVLQ